MSDKSRTHDGQGPSTAWARSPAAIAATAVFLIVLTLIVGFLVSGSEGDGDGAASATGSTSPGGVESDGADAQAGDSSKSTKPGRALDGARAEANRPRGKPAPLTAARSASPTVTVAISQAEWVKGETTVPGEVGGPSLRVTVEATNESDSALELPGPVVNAYYGADRAPSSFLMEPGSKPFPDAVAPGETVDGVFVFTMPRDPALKVEIEADLDPGLRIITFEGRAQDLL